MLAATRQFDKGKYSTNHAPIYPLLSMDTAKMPPTYNPDLYKYLQEIRQYQVLDREEANSLAVRFQQEDDQEAGRLLVLSNLRLVVKIALSYKKYWSHNFLDLVQEGNIGLLRAVKKFDPYRGIKFSYYASYWIRAHILKFIVDNWRVVKICTTEAMRKLFFNLNREIKSLELQGIKPDDELLAQRLQVKKSQVTDAAKRINFSDLSFDAPLRGDSEQTLQNITPDTAPATEEIAAKHELKDQIKQVLAAAEDKLSERERFILRERLFTDAPLTLQAIAEIFKVSRERIRQLEAQLLYKLRVVFKRKMPDLAGAF
ncbi:MAG: sigma-70 family RNA polymerase sigma factor [Deltaproteobacteria bacterium]|nr:sigma-70 family RNA polymerase sigma factor [Deltaproteobacteria bacterium]